MVSFSPIPEFGALQVYPRPKVLGHVHYHKVFGFLLVPLFHLSSGKFRLCYLTIF